MYAEALEIMAAARVNFIVIVYIVWLSGEVLKSCKKKCKRRNVLGLTGLCCGITRERDKERKTMNVCLLRKKNINLLLSMVTKYIDFVEWLPRLGGRGAIRNETRMYVTYDKSEKKQENFRSLSKSSPIKSSPGDLANNDGSYVGEQLKKSN